MGRPPPPSVEDEAKSLSREHTPELPELIGGEAQMRGAVDQQPLMLEVETTKPKQEHTVAQDQQGTAYGSSTMPMNRPGTARHLSAKNARQHEESSSDSDISWDESAGHHGKRSTRPSFAQDRRPRQSPTVRSNESYSTSARASSATRPVIKSSRHAPPSPLAPAYTRSRRPSPTAFPRKPALNIPEPDYFEDRPSSYAPRSRHTSPLPSPEPTISKARSRPTTQPTDLANNTGLPIRPRSRESSATFEQARKPQIPTQPSRTPTAVASRPSPTKAARPPPRLPRCPRPSFVAGCDDWSTIEGIPDLDVCPTCRKAIEEAGFQGQFVRSPPRVSGSQTRCDVSIPWVRMAWLIALGNQSVRANSVRDMMNVMAHELPCPGQAGDIRDWYGVMDTNARSMVGNFDVCSFCVRSLETIFPNLKGSFHLTQRRRNGAKRTCDMRVDSSRFARYVDLLQEVSEQASECRRPADMTRFVQFAKEMARIRECNRDDLMLNQAWHFIPELPEFTVCEDCYFSQVWPAMRRGSALAGRFNRTLQLPYRHPMGHSCQLYSPRMRDVFETSCRRNDFSALQAAARKRVLVERDLQQRLAAVQARAMPGESRATEIEKLVAEWKRWE